MGHVISLAIGVRGMAGVVWNQDQSGILKEFVSWWTNLPKEGQGKALKGIDIVGGRLSAPMEVDIFKIEEGMVSHFERYRGKEGLRGII